MLSTNKLTLLHSIRGFAAFYVVIYHAKFPLWVGGKEYINHFPRAYWGVMEYLIFAIDMISANGTGMVIVFFVLSGFFIAYSFDKDKWKLKNFYINRLIRIYVPFLFSVFFSIGILILVRKINPTLAGPNIKREFNESLVQAFNNFNGYQLARTLLFIPFGLNKYIGFNMVYWSLLYESIFYLLIPVIIKRPNVYLYVSLLTFALSFFFKNQNPLIKYFLDYSIYFVIGLNLFLFIKLYPTFKPLKPALFITLIFVTFLAVVGLALKNYIQVSHMFAGLLSVFLIVFLINYNIRENFVLNFFKKIGVFSYTLYLFHFPILILFYAVVTKITGIYLIYNRIYWIGVVAALIISYPIYFLVEDKSLNLISKLKKKPVVSPLLK